MNQWHGYADAKPSESIQAHELPGLAGAVVFPYLPGVEVLPVPIKQYKDYKPRSKGDKANELSQWLLSQKEKGLVLRGFFHAHTQIAAANLGLELIQELPNTHVEPHYDSFRLYFGDEQIDFAQAIALEYYFFTINFGVLRAGMSLPEKSRKLFVAMDRFPGPDTQNTAAGKPMPRTQGSKFLDFVYRYSKTAQGIEASNKSAKFESRLGNIDWWRPDPRQAWKKGKTHPHFILPDWLAAAAIAKEFRDEFVASFKKTKDGEKAATGLEELYNTFKKFDLWSMDHNVLPHIRAEEKLWEIPEDAQNYIMRRAGQR